MSRPESPIRDVSDTAFWIAQLRALESERADALFRDPLAAELAGERGRRIAHSMFRSELVGWTVALRTRIIDEFIAGAIAGGVDTVVNLGAGLDARPYRLSLPAALRWIEADYPHLVDYKEQRLQGRQPHCQLQRVPIDLAQRAERRALLARVDAQSQAILFLTEGVIPYLSNDEVAALAQDLHALRHVRFWIVDYMSARAMKIRSRGRVARSMGNAPFRFQPGDWFGFFRRHGWPLKQARYFSDEALRLRRPIPLPRRYRLLYALSWLWTTARQRSERRRFAGYALLEPARAA